MVDPVGYENLVDELSQLLLLCPPPFIYVNDATTAHLTANLIADVLGNLDDPLAQIHSAYVDAVSCFNSRIFYDTVLNAIVAWKPNWQDGCANWNVANDTGRWNDSLDGFLHGLRKVDRHCSDLPSAKRKNGNVRLVVAINRAERLRDNVPELIVPLTRLAELVCPIHNPLTTK